MIAGLVPTLLFAQPCKLQLKGQITDADTGTPIPFANLVLEESQQGTISDEDGFFQIGQICKGSYHLSVSHIGCETQRHFMTINADTSVVLQLEHYSQVLDGVVVTGKARPNGTQSSQWLGEQRILLLSNQNMATMLQGLTGVSVLRNGSNIAKPVVHGLYGNRLLILNNGVAQSGQQWGNDHSPEIDPLAANKITVVKGVGALEYQGSSLGSVILVETGNLDDEPHLHGRAGYYFETNGRGHGLHLHLAQKRSSLGWAVRGTLRQNGDRQTPSYFLSNTGGKEANLALQIEKQHNAFWKSQLYLSTFNTELGILRGSHIGNLTDLQEALGRAIPFFTASHFSYTIQAPRQAVGHQLAKWRTLYTPNSQNWLELLWVTQYNNRKEYDVRRSGRSDVPALSLQQWNHVVQATFQHYFKDGLKIKTGLQASFTDNTNNPETGILPLIPDYLSVMPGGFALLQRQWPHWLLEVGTRYDYTFQDVATISNTTPRTIVRYTNHFHTANTAIGLNFTPTDAMKAAFNLGLATRNPAVNELYSLGLHQGVSGIEEGSLDLHVERSLKATLSLEARAKERLFFEMLAYFQRVDNYIFLNPQDEIRLTIRGAFPVFKYEQTDARLLGLDIATTWQPHARVSTQVKYSFLRGQDVRQDIPLINMPANNLLASASYQLPSLGKLENIEVEANAHHVWEQTNWQPGQDYVAPPTAYTLLGLKIAAQLALRSQRLQTYLRVDNALNTTYRDYLNRLRYFADDLGRNVVLGVSWGF